MDTDAAEAIINGASDEIDYSIPEDDELPFACFICRDDFKNPVVTVCGHYFCGPCAMEDNKKNPKCRVCGKKTHGVFNKAVKLLKKLASAGKLKDGERESGPKIGGGVKLKETQGKWEQVDT